MRAVARSGKPNNLYGGDDHVMASRIDSFLDVNLVFSREHQVYILSVEKMNEVLYNRMKSAYEFYLDGIESALKVNKCIAGDFISLADISFVCDVGYFLKEVNQRDVLKAQGFDLISEKFKDEYPQCADHLVGLSKQEEFSTVITDGFISL